MRGARAVPGLSGARPSPYPHLFIPVRFACGVNCVEKHGDGGDRIIIMLRMHH